PISCRPRFSTPRSSASSPSTRVRKTAHIHRGWPRNREESSTGDLRRKLRDATDITIRTDRQRGPVGCASRGLAPRVKGAIALYLRQAYANHMPDRPLHPRTRAVHHGIRRSQYGEMAEALFLTQGFAYD